MSGEEGVPTCGISPAPALEHVSSKELTRGGPNVRFRQLDERLEKSPRRVDAGPKGRQSGETLGRARHARAGVGVAEGILVLRGGREAVSKRKAGAAEHVVSKEERRQGG